MRAPTKNNLKRSFSVFLCLLLIISVCFGSPIQMFAQAFQPAMYVEDIEIYVVEAGKGSASEAEKYFNDKGWVFPGIELNPGNGTKMEAYLGYKITSNRDMAIRDIRFLAMNVGYQLYNYRQITEYIKSQHAGTAQTMYASAVELADNYSQGSPKAADAYEGLNLFYIEETGEKLGDCIVNRRASLDLFVNILTKSSAGTLNAVINFLNSGISPYMNEYDDQTDEIVTACWAENVSHSELWEMYADGMTTDEENELDRIYSDSARELFKRVQEFTSNYEDARSRYVPDAGSVSASDADTAEVLDNLPDTVEDDDTDKLYITAYETLNRYTAYADVKLGDFLVRLGRQTSDTVDISRLYPVIEAMGDNQAHLACMSGILCAVGNLSENTYSELLAEVIPEAKEAIKEYNNGDAISLWDNADKELEDSYVAFTSDAVRRHNSEQTIGYKSAKEIGYEEYQKAMKIINIVSGVVNLVILIVKPILEFAVAHLLVAYGYQALCTFCCYALQAVMIVSSFSRFVGMVILIVSLAVMLCMWIDETFFKETNWIAEHTAMPDYVLDTIETTAGTDTVKYKTVLGRDGKPADINCRKQQKWDLMAYTRDSRVGSPVCADETGTAFLRVTGNPLPKSGYESVRYFGEINPGNANAFCEDDDVSGCYLHYRTEDSLNNKSAEPAALPEDGGENTDKADGGYIKDIIIETAASEAEAKAKVINHERKYNTIDYNLSPDTGVFTYLGYELTNNPKEAITDIRVAPYVGSAQQNINYGDVSYALAAVVGFVVSAKDKQAIPQCDAVYITRDRNAGTPIPADGLRTAGEYDDEITGWEPVSFFGSDLPYNFNTKLMYDELDNLQMAGYLSQEYNNLNTVRRSYLYYRPETQYTEGDKYLSGVFFIGGHDNEGASYLYNDNKESFRSLIDRVNRLRNGVVLSGVNLSQVFSELSHIGMKNIQSYLCYTWTYNPHRALTNISLYQGDGFSDSLQYVMAKTAGSRMENYVACAYISQQPTNLSAESQQWTAGQGWFDDDRVPIVRFVDPSNAFMNKAGMLNLSSSLKSFIRDGYTDVLPENIDFGYKKAHYLPTGLYVTGYREGVQPLLLENVVVSPVRHDASQTDSGIVCDVSSENTLGGTKPAGAFHPIYELKDPNSMKAFNLAYTKFSYSHGMYDDTGGFLETLGLASSGSYDGSELYIYLSGAKKAKGKYITSLSIGAFSRDSVKQQYPNAEDEQIASADAIANKQALAQAACGCKDEVIVYNIAAKSQSDAWYNKQNKGVSSTQPTLEEPAAYIGVTRSDGPAEDAITGILLYKLDDSTAPAEKDFYGMKYKCAGTQVPIDMNGTKYYLYYTSNKAARPGRPITDIVIDNTPIVTGMATNLCADNLREESYGEPEQTSFIHAKYESDKQGEFFNKLYIGHGYNKRAALCDLLAQGCIEYIDIDLNEGIVGKSIYMGYRKGTVDYNKVQEQTTPEAQQKELISQRQEAVYDIVVTKHEDYHPEGIVVDNIYYYPVSDKNLTEGEGHKLYMYYTCTYASNRYNNNNNADTVMPHEAFTGYVSNIGYTRYDRVPYNSQFAGVPDAEEQLTPWEYVMLSDKSSHVNLNSGAVAFDKSDPLRPHAWDNRVNMFVQRSDSSVKPAGEITGGFVERTMQVGTGYVND